MIIKST